MDGVDKMDRRILDLIADYQQWNGNLYKLAALIAELQREMTRENLASLGHAEAAESV